MRSANRLFNINLSHFWVFLLPYTLVDMGLWDVYLSFTGLNVYWFPLFNWLMSIVQSKRKSLCFEIHPFHFKHLSVNFFSFSHKYQDFRMCSLLVNRFSVIFQHIAIYLAGFHGTWFFYSSDWYFQYLIMRSLANWHLLSILDFSWTCKCQNLRPLTFISLARCLRYQYRFLCFKT